MGLADKVKPLGTVGEDEVVAIKLHFGEAGNDTYLHPTFVRQVVDCVKATGARPFLTDTCTLYKSTRHNAVDHLETAYRHALRLCRGRPADHGRRPCRSALAKEYYEDGKGKHAVGNASMPDSIMEMLSGPMKLVMSLMGGNGKPKPAARSRPILHGHSHRHRAGAEL